MPITGGNVSLYNETLGEAIFPTPVIGIVGLMENADRCSATIPASPGARSSCCSAASAVDEAVRRHEYAKVVLDESLGPAAGARHGVREARPGGACARSREAARGESAHDLSDGGLAVALAECCFRARGVGAQASIEPSDVAIDARERAAAVPPRARRAFSFRRPGAPWPKCAAARGCEAFPPVSALQSSGSRLRIVGAGDTAGRRRESAARRIWAGRWKAFRHMQSA